MSRVVARGFTLFEVMISLLILTTAILATLALLPIGIKSQQLSRSQMYAASTAMTLINNFHTPVDKFEGVSRLAPRYDGIPGTDSINPAANPFTGWAGQIRDQLVHASPFQPNLEQQAGWLTGVLPVPIEIARRLDSDHDEVQNLLDQGGVLYYPDPNFMMGLNQGAAMDKTMQVTAAPEVQKLVFAVTSLPQQNALSSNPAESLPWYEVYPFPPEWLGMQARGRETRRMVAVGGNEGGSMPLYDANPPAPNSGRAYNNAAETGEIYPSWSWTQPQWWSMMQRGGWPPWPGGVWQDAWPNPGSFGPTPSGQTFGGLPWPSFHLSGQSMSGGTTGDWSWCLAMLSYDDGGHGRYEPVVFGRPMRPGQEHDTWPGIPATDPRNNAPIDHPNANDDWLNPSAADPTIGKYFGNGFAQGRNWRFFANKLGNLWMLGNGVPAANEPAYTVPNVSKWSWYCFQRLAGGDDSRLSQPRNSYAGPTAAGPGIPSDPDPLDGVQNQFHRSGWLPIRALLANPDFPSYEGLQNIDYMELHKRPWLPKKFPITYADHQSVYGGAPIASPGGRITNHTRAPNAGISPDPNDPTETQEHLNLRNLTFKTRSPQTVNPPATYEMRANYRDRAIDLWQAVMPTNAPATPASIMRKNPDQLALVSDIEGGTMVDCDRYEYPPSELDKFQMILPKDLDAADWPPHPAQVLALSYLAHAAMMVTGYAPPFGENIATGSYKGVVDNMRVSWECLNWTYAKHSEPDTNEVSLYCTNDPVPTPPATGTGGPTWDAVPIVPSATPWAYPWPYDGHFTAGNIIPGQIQPWPVSHRVVGQGITKDALVVAEDAPPGAAGATFSKIKLVNDTNHKWLVYPGDELLFQISYLQWWYKYGKGGENCPNLWCGSMPDIWDQNDSHNVWDGRYDPDAPGWWWGGSNATYPNLQYKCQTFHVYQVEDESGLTYVETGGRVVPHQNGAAVPAQSATNYIWVYVTPALPSYPLQYNDARANVGADLDPVALHKGTLVRRVANQHDLLFARKVYEMCMQWAAAYAAEMPNDLGAPKPANHQTMMDKPLALYDLFFDATNPGGANAAIRVPQQPASSAGSSTSESYYRWMVTGNQVPDAWFYPTTPTGGKHGLSHFGPGRERSDYFEQMAYNHELQQPTADNDDRHYWLNRPFRAFHRCRSLTFWSVDWKEYEDAETVPSAPIDWAKHGRFLHRAPAGPGYDGILPYLEYGHSPLLGHPESLYMWTSPERSRRYVDVVGGESAGFLYQSWVGALGQPGPGLHAPTTSNLLPTPTAADPPPTDGQPVSADVHLGHWGADRNGNGVLDLGAVPRGTRMKALHVSDVLYYDPVLRLHYGN